VGVGGGGLRDESAEAEEVPGRRDVVAGFVPEIRESKKAVVRDVDADEQERVEHPERDITSRLLAVFTCSA
jgi:hypothetical protein